MKALSVFTGLVIANIAYQLVSDNPNYLVALERSWFQGTALFCYYLMDKYVWRS